ncbi:type VI secretion system protein TssA [Inquilinus ginsengisoli]|uniref:type VI secretion system protein TssA n=1 Tax=Inquilinus ginsengisoli TaxID=363840 RepID=UPI00286CFF68|nr:type VI secretion system protein TssA [Inquilinus ginsengisoli]
MAATDPEELLDLEKVLGAISEDAAAGSDPRLDVTPQSLYFRLRDARSEARAEERLADNDPGADTGVSRHWAAVGDLAVEALSTKAKDIEIAAWLTESLVRRDGLAGLTAGAKVLSGLVSRYWNDGLFPMPDEDGLAGRVAPVAGLSGEGGNGTLLQPLRKLVLYERADGTLVTYWQFEQSEEVEALEPQRKAQRLASGVLPFADLEAEAKTIGREPLSRILGAVTQAIEAWRGVDEALTAAAADSAPPTGRVHDLLEKLRRIAERYAPLPETPAAGPAPEVEQAAGDNGAAAAPAPANRAPTREEMLQEITRIAAYFRVSEPNSPLSYTLEDAVRRARLALPDLLKEMMPELATRSAVLSGLGIKPPSD